MCRSLPQPGLSNGRVISFSIGINEGMSGEFDQQLVAFLRKCADRFERWPQLYKNVNYLRELADAAPGPFRIAIVGRMKTGKSTLINTLIRRPLVITGVEEATATINIVSYGTEEQSREFVVVWRNNRAEPFPIDLLPEHWVGKTSEVIERIRKVRHLQLFVDEDQLKEYDLVDTPGNGSAVEGHEDVAKEYLRPEAIEDSLKEARKADAIVYVMTFARESDEDALAVFGSGRIASSDPYNSICVIHKWDDLVENDPYPAAETRAQRVHEKLKDKVLKAMPISAPLALAFHHAPESFYESLVNLIRSQDGSELAGRLKRDTRWDADPTRQSIRAIYPELPWASFQMLVSHYLRQPPESVSQARNQCLELSHMAEFEKTLRSHFFANSLIIKQCQVLKKAQHAIESSFILLRQLAEKEAKDIDRASHASRSLADLELAEWASRKAEDAQSMNALIDELALELDQEWQSHQRRLEGLQGDLQVRRHLHNADCIFPEGHHSTIRKVCNPLRDGGLDPSEVVSLIRHYRRSLPTLIEADAITMTEHLLRRLDEAHHALKHSPESFSNS